MLTNQNFKAGQQIQVKTKTNRHQLHNVWLNILRVNDKKVTAQVPGEDSTWGIPKSMIIKVREAGSTLPEGHAVMQPKITVELIYKEMEMIRAEFDIKMAELKRKMQAL